MTTPIHPRERLIATASRLVHQQGWNATGINQILIEAEIPKGSFYYYFRSKEALGVALLRAHKARASELMSKTLLDGALDPVDALEAYFTGMDAWLGEAGHRFGCPIGSFTNEVAAASPALNEESKAAFQMMEDAWADFIRRAQISGAVASDVDSRKLATIAVMMVQGSCLSMKYSGDRAPFQNARTTLTGVVFGTGRSRLKAVGGQATAQPLAS